MTAILVILLWGLRFFISIVHIYLKKAHLALLMAVASNLARLTDELQGMTDRDISIVAVTKKATREQVQEAIRAGIRIVGESRVKEGIGRLRGLDVEKHMIGHLQKNKVRLAVENFDCIQSLDSMKLAAEISKRAAKMAKVMIEINIGNEPQKYGVAADYAAQFYDEVRVLPNIKVVGIMAVAPDVGGAKARPYFRKMREIHDSLGTTYLSMGMSNDYRQAVEEGSNMIRVGSLLFKQQTK
jgi:PLP dependent protein